MADMDEDNMDLETLQAQIDMSMAFTHDLVSGWMKSSKVKLPSSSRANDDRELEEYMRRPPRLGVGASAPEASGVLSRETAKLRNKLVGNSKKRAREEDDAAGPATASSASKPIVVSDDDDEDSRARVITKKARVDPFAPKTKKKKADPLHALSPAPPMSPAKTAVGDTSTKAPLSQDAASKDGLDADGQDSSISKKRKKKKKHKVQGDDAEDPQSIASASRDCAIASISEKHGTEAAAASGAGEPDKGPLSTKLSVPASTEAPSPKPAHTGAPGSQPQAPATPARPSSAASLSSPQRLDPFGMPLLNLSGPPPQPDEEQSASPKKKRKKKKKKKKKAVSGVDVAATAAGPDGDAEDDDDDDA